jgi:hypothetical protein
MERKSNSSRLRSGRSFNSAGVGGLAVFLLVFMLPVLVSAQSAFPSGVSPSSGSGSAQLFAVTIGDPNGGSDVAEAVLNIMSNVIPGSTGWSAHECLLRYDFATNAIWIVPDAGGAWSGPITAGTNGTLSNSQCSVLASGSSAQVSGTTATAKFLVTFTATFAAAKQLYLEGEDVRGNWSTNFQQLFGNYSVAATASPLSLTPVSGSGTNQVFSATYYNPNGGTHVAEAELYVMSNIAPGSVGGWSANECIFQYDVATTNIWQVIDGGGSYQGPITAGSQNYLSNSQCTIFAAGSSAQVSGNTVKVNFAVTFTGAAFNGGKQLYLGSEDTLGNWATNFNQQFGSWSIPAGQANGPPSIPNSFTAGAPSLTCDSISGQWFDADAFGNSIGWDLTQSGTSVSGTLSFDDYRNFGAGLTYCGTISYTASGIYNGSGSYSLSAVNPVPSVDSCGLPLAPSEAETVTLSGQACGGGTGAFTISSGNPQPLSRSRAHTAMNMAARPAQTSGGSTWTTVTPRFSVQYASYIPVDNIHGPTPCAYTPLFGDQLLIPHLYKGDANRGTYRTTQSIFVVPDKQFSDNFFPNAGPTRNYGLGSPINGSVLSSSPTTSDIYNGPYTGADEDNVQFDCITWNDRGKADLSTMQGHTVTFPTSNQAQVNLTGLGQDPLEPKVGGIKWNATVTLNDTNSSQPTASVTITHTCYPAHIVKVNGTTVYSYQPGLNNTLYLLSCLTFVPQNTVSTGAVVVPSH